MKKIPLAIIAVSPQYNYAHTYNLVLEEQNGNRRMCVTISMQEAMSMSVLMEGLDTERPLIYEFIDRLAKSFDIHVCEVVIANVTKENFYSEIVCHRNNAPEDEIVRLQARIADAVAIALKFRCPIYTYEVVLDAIGYNAQSSSECSQQHTSSKYRDLTTLSDEALNCLLAKAIQRENYEFATKIRDEIKRRNTLL